MSGSEILLGPQWPGRLADFRLGGLGLGFVPKPWTPKPWLRVQGFGFRVSAFLGGWVWGFRRASPDGSMVLKRSRVLDILVLGSGSGPPMARRHRAQRIFTDTSWTLKS